MRKMTAAAIAFAAAGIVFLTSGEAEAQSLIKNPDAHPDYTVELEPHGNLSPWRRRFGPYRGRRGGVGDPEVGAGFRASIEVADPAFIPKLNNTVAVSFGLDMTTCPPCRNDFTLYLPIATLQWNFFFTEHWSAFPDLGLTMRTDGFYDDVYLDFVAMLGGRYHFNDDVALTMRIGYPFISVGASFFL
jgi:hypothetical protein